MILLWKLSLVVGKPQLAMISARHNQTDIGPTIPPPRLAEGLSARMVRGTCFASAAATLGALLAHSQIRHTEAALPGCADDDNAVRVFSSQVQLIEADPTVVTCAGAADATRQLLCADTHGP